MADSDSPTEGDGQPTKDELERARQLIVAGETALNDGNDPSFAEIEESIGKFSEALELAGSHPGIAYFAHVGLARHLSMDAFQPSVEDLKRAAANARAARRATEHFVEAEPSRSDASALLAQVLRLVVDRVGSEERNLAIVEAVAMYRESAQATSDESKRVRRLANAAGLMQLPDSRPPGKSAIEWLAQATEIHTEILASSALGTGERATVTITAAHVQQRRAAAERLSGSAAAAADAFATAEALYADGIERCRQQGVSTAAAESGLALLRHEMATASNDDALLDNAIELATRAVSGHAGESFEPVARLQLARMHLTRYQRHHRPSDAAHADRLCQEALANRLQFEVGSTAYIDAVGVRVEVLAGIALSDIRRDSHFIELDDLLDELHPGEARPPDREAIHLMAMIGRIVAATGEQAATAYDRMIETADALRSVLENTSLGMDDPAWWTRWGSMHRRAADWAELARVRDETWLAHLGRASERLAIQLEAFDPSSETYALGHLMVALAAKAMGIKLGRKSELRRATQLLEVAYRCAGAPPPLIVDIAKEASYLCELLQDTEAATSWVGVAATALLELEMSDSAPPVARLATDGVRSELAGDVAALATDAMDVAWRLHRVRRGLPDDPTARALFIEAAAVASAEVTLVYIAQSRRRCRAAIVDRGAWSILEMPALATDEIGGVIRGAHVAHARANGSSSAWTAERAALHDSLDRGLRALVSTLRRDTRPVAVHLSGWLHAVPIAPILSSAVGHVRTIAISLGLGTVDAPVNHRTCQTTALAAPGDAIVGDFLPNATPDALAVAKMLSCRVIPNATVNDLTASLLSSEVVLFSGHGVSADEPLDARLLLRDGALTAGAIIELDLRGLKLAVVAACESFATDRRTPEHPFNVQVALLHAGAAATCGPQWAIEDGVASVFTRTLFDNLSHGQRFSEAFNAASAEACAARSNFRDISLLVRNADALADIVRWRHS